MDFWVEYDQHILDVVPYIVSPSFETRSSRRVETCGGRSKAQDAGLWLPAGTPRSRVGFFLPKNELQSSEVNQAKVAERENPARMGDGELNMHTKPEIR